MEQPNAKKLKTLICLSARCHSLCSLLQRAEACLDFVLTRAIKLFVFIRENPCLSVAKRKKNLQPKNQGLIVYTNVYLT
jgi:hypothetical protein